MPRMSIARIITITLFDLVFASSFLITWISPSYLGEHALLRLGYLIALEVLAFNVVFVALLIVHRVGAVKHPVRAIGGICVFAVLFVVAACISYEGLWPLLAMLLLLVPKLIAIIGSAGDNSAYEFSMQNWMWTFLIFVASAGLVRLLTERGWDFPMIEKADFQVSLVVAPLGFFYFVGVAMLSLIQEVRAAQS